MLVEQSNFISNDLCDYFIKHHNNNPHDFKHRNTSIISCEMQSYQGNWTFKFLLKKLNFFVDSKVKNTFVNYSQIVRWPKGEYQEEHKDFDYHTFTSILYLNDEYEGGHTVVGNKFIKPEKGKIVLFDGNKTDHRVLPISSGTRYTNATWYITKTEQEIIV